MPKISIAYSETLDIFVALHLSQEINRFVNLKDFPKTIYHIYGWGLSSR